MRIIQLFILSGLLIQSCTSRAQTIETQYAMELEAILEEIENRYEVDLNYNVKLVEGKELEYALWRFRPDLEVTLTNVLLPFDLHWEKQAENRFKIKEFQYHRLSVKEGREKLEYLSNKYHDVDSWEKRAGELRACINETLGLDKLPPSPDSEPLLSKERKMKGYTVQNVAIETLPGLYLCASVYRPAKIKGKIPVIVSPNGHGSQGRYHPDMQLRCASLARMGAMVVNYDKFAYGESLLQFEAEDHRTSTAMQIQALNDQKILDYMLSLPEADANRVGMTGASGGGSATMLASALDPRIKIAVPVVMFSVIHNGGCPCESGLGIHLCGGGSTNVEFASMFAPKPQLIITDGGDWTANVPELEFPHIQRIYEFFGEKDAVQNVHFPEGRHDYNFDKRKPMYAFMAEHLDLDIDSITNEEGEIDESFATTESPEEMYAFGKKGELLPENAIKSLEELLLMINK